MRAPPPSESLPAPPGGLQRVRLLVATAVMLSGGIMMALIFTVLSPVLPQIADHYSSSGGVTIAQFIMSAPGVGVIVGGLTGGYLVDRFGRKRLLCIALAVFAAAGCAPLYVDSAWGLLASRAILGWSGATTQAAVIGMIASTFREPLRAKMIGYEAAIGSFAAVCSILASGAIAETAGWRAPATLYLFALPVLLAALIAIPADARRRPAPAAARGDDRPAAASFAAFIRPLLPFFLIIPFVYAANFMLSIQMPFLLAENGVEGPAAKARLMVIAVGTGVLGAASSGWIRQGLGERVSFALCVSLMGAGHLTLGFAHSAPMTILGGAVAGLGGGMLLPNLMAIATSRASDDLRSRAAGLVYTMAYVGEFFNPVVFRPLSTVVGIHGTFEVVGAALLALAALAIGFAWRGRAASKPRKA
jgi:MFS family permease